MDVRCHQCRTEYELDESKLKPGGVTVKCTNCGHMFKVRRRITAVGPAVVGPPTLKNRAAAEVDEPEAAAGGDRVWLIRLANGEILTCRELSTLQKWIAEGRVTRTCEISRTGKKWKVLGSIGELASFFEIADEVRDGAARAPSASLVPAAKAPHPDAVAREPVASVTGPAPTVSAGSSGAPPVHKPPTAPPPISPPAELVALASKPTLLAGASADDVAAVAAASPPAQPSPPAQSGSGPSPRASAADVRAETGDDPIGKFGKIESQPSPDERNTGQWATSGPIGGNFTDSGPSGPTGGLARSIPTTDAAFTNRLGDIKGEFENGAFVPTDDPAYSDPGKPPSGAGKWIALVSVLIIAAAAVALYFVVFRSDDGDGEKIVSADIDAGPVAPVADAGVPSDDGAATTVETALASAAAELAGDTPAGLEVALEKIAALPEAAVEAKKIPVLLARAQLEAAIGQHQIDEAATIKRASAKKKLIAAARARASRVEDYASMVLKADRNNAVAMVGRADALRLRGKRRREVDRWLRKALKADPKNREALLSRGLLYLRDDKPRDARKAFGAVTPADGDVRASYRIAQLDVADGNFTAAKKRVREVLAAQPEHDGALALRTKIDESLAVVASDPLPPEEGTEEVKDDPDREAGDGDSGDATLDESGSYDRLLARGDKAAERGSCSAARTYYERALDINPSGVAALTGLGYCYLDSSQYHSAFAKFRAALGISSRYQSAMWGMAELYERQGRTTDAIAAYRKFTAAHPRSRRAEVAKRKIRALGGAVDSDGAESAVPPSGSGAGTGSAEPTGGDPGTGPAGTDPPPNPEPGSGSGEPPVVKPESAPGTTTEPSSGSEPAGGKPGASGADSPDDDSPPPPTP